MTLHKSSEGLFRTPFWHGLFEYISDFGSAKQPTNVALGENTQRGGRMRVLVIKPWLLPKCSGVLMPLYTMYNDMRMAQMANVQSSYL